MRLLSPVVSELRSALTTADWAGGSLANDRRASKYNACLSGFWVTGSVLTGGVRNKPT